MSVVRRLSLDAQHVVVAALRNHLQNYPDSKIIPPILERLAVSFPCVFVAETREDSSLITQGAGDMCDIIADFPTRLT